MGRYVMRSRETSWGNNVGQRRRVERRQKIKCKQMRSRGAVEVVREMGIKKIGPVRVEC